MPQNEKGNDARALCEVVVDIALYAGKMAGQNKFSLPEDSSAFSKSLVEAAQQFESVFDKDAHGDDYFVLVDAYAQHWLSGNKGLALMVLDGMKSTSEIRRSSPEEMAQKLGIAYTPYQYLPNPAKCALEYLDCQADRSIEKLHSYLDHYFTVTGQTCDEHIRWSCEEIAKRRFGLTA